MELLEVNYNNFQACPTRLAKLQAVSILDGAPDRIRTSATASYVALLRQIHVLIRPAANESADLSCGLASIDLAGI